MFLYESSFHFPFYYISFFSYYIKIKVKITLKIVQPIFKIQSAKSPTTALLQKKTLEAFPRSLLY